MTAPLQDADLFAVTTSEPEAFAQFVARHHLPLHRFVARRIGAAAAEDVVSEVFEPALRRAHTYDGRPDARPWLCTAAGANGHG